MFTNHKLLKLLRGDDWKLHERLTQLRDPDLIIDHGEPDNPYIYRWHLIERNHVGNCYYHIQMRDDSDRGLHDHNYDNQSVILAGGYIETLQKDPAHQGPVETLLRVPGDTVQRKAAWAHRLALPAGVPYSMSIFSTGPRIQPWGFWLPEGPGLTPIWVDAAEVFANPTAQPGYTPWKEPAHATH